MYCPFKNVLFRIPFFSIQSLERCLRNNIYLNNGPFNEAVYLASPILYSEMQKLLKDEIKTPKEKDHISFSIYKYLSRMATRCTPFGLFAGCTLGQLSDKTDILIGDKIEKHTRLDMYYLCALTQVLARLPEIRSHMNYYPNSSLYVSGKKYRYIECTYINTKRLHQISAVDKSKYLKNILTKAELGVKQGDLLSYLTEKGIPKSDAITFIDELIDSQILVGEFNPTVTGDDYLDRIALLLDSICKNNEYIPAIKSIQKQLGQADSAKNYTVAFYKSIIENIKKINVPYEEKFIFQVDMIREAQIATLGKDVLKELQSAILFLNKITPDWKNETLAKFQQAFYERYEDREIPLMEALDTEWGLGYPASTTSQGDISPLLDNFYLPTQVPSQMYTINAFQSLLFSKAQEALSNNLKEIIFTDKDIQSFKENWNDLPPTLCCLFEIIPSKAHKCLIKINSIGGSCAANVLARFAHTSIGIEKWVNEIVNKEQELMSDVVLAEIAHLPDSRIGNILSRPHIRDYEILYLAQSDLSRERTIYMSDLTLSVRKGKLCLRSKKLNKEIVPRLTNAHNYRNNSMPVYTFLCDMQMQQGRNSLFFDWGNLKNELTFFPRVRYKNIILSLMTWKIRIDSIKSLITIKEDKILLEEAKEWRIKKSIPRYVLLPDGDNKLFVDWESSLSLRSFFSVIKKRQTITLTEFLFEPESAIVKDFSGDSYLNECIVAFYREVNK